MSQLPNHSPSQPSDDQVIPCSRAALDGILDPLPMHLSEGQTAASSEFFFKEVDWKYHHHHHHHHLNDNNNDDDTTYIITITTTLYSKYEKRLIVFIKRK